MRNPVLYMACIGGGLPPVHAELACKLIEDLDLKYTDLLVVVFRERQRVYSRTGAHDLDHTGRDGCYEHVVVMHPKEWFSSLRPRDEVRWLWTKQHGVSPVGIPPEWFDE